MEVGTTTRWRRIETLFHQASEMEPARREAFIGQACAGDPELRAELDSLLSSPDLTLAELKIPVAIAAGDLLGAASAELERIGAYRLIRTLGEGGMGTVYLGARDDDQYQRMVAIKVLRAGLTHRPELQLLFRTERQILADFDHPNIARMLDGGITPQGSPYLVMEYIDGIALDVYCRQENLPLDARLRLFRTLVAAIDYAHRHLVIHRDIKPLNVLVTPDGTPKLLDFGIAKLIDPYQSPSSQVLLAGNEQMLTPDYASPEQLLGRPVSTATDVYALGVLLFELLTGELPFARARSEPMAQARAICEQSPERPSEVCLRTHHLSSPEAQKIRGDLDSIVLKTLRKQPEQRYAAAAQFLEDLDRYFKSLPVEAAVQSIPYRMRKFVRRHRVGVAISMLAALLIVGFAAAMALLARRATRGEAKARREEQFLESIFRAATPEGSKGENVTARQLLDQAAGRLDMELGSDPELRAEMTENIAQSYVAVGMYGRAQPLLERALQLTEQNRGQTSVSYAEGLGNLATDLRLQSEYAKAEPLFRRAVAINENLYGQRSFASAHSLSNLGECLYWEERDPEAEHVLRQALAIERPLADNQQDGTRNYLALVLERRGAYPEAAQLLRESNAIAGRVLGKQSADYLISLHDLAGAQIDMGDLEGAARSEHEVLTTRQKIWGRNHPDTAYSLNNLGWIYLELGRHQMAEPLLKENVAIMRAISSAPGPLYVSSLANWGRLLEQKGDYAGAAKAYGEAMQLLAAGGHRESWGAAKIMGYQSLLDLDRRRYPDAIRLAESAVQIERKLGGDSNPQLSAGLLVLGLANLLGGAPNAAETAFRDAEGIRQRSFPAGHPELLLAQVRLAEALLAERRPQDALDLMKPAFIAAKAAPFQLPSWRMAELQFVYGVALRETGHEKEAVPLIAENLSNLQGYSLAAVRTYLMRKLAR
jgi:serine/threonine-protein kinase